jgi:phosphoserine phosphatase
MRRFYHVPQPKYVPIRTTTTATIRLHITIIILLQLVTFHIVQIIALVRVNMRFHPAFITTTTTAFTSKRFIQQSHILTSTTPFVSSSIGYIPSKLITRSTSSVSSTISNTDNTISDALVESCSKHHHTQNCNCYHRLNDTTPTTSTYTGFTFGTQQKRTFASSTATSTTTTRSSNRPLYYSNPTSYSLPINITDTIDQQLSSFSTIRTMTSSTAITPPTTTTTTTTADSSGNDHPKISGTDMMNALIQYKQDEHHIHHPTLIGQNVATCIEMFLSADCICFDVDSTVIQEEGIDVLADFLGKGTAVANLTKRAMEGGMKFQDALEARLSLLQPSKLQIESCLRDHPFQLTKGIKELIQLLHQYHKDVFFISGGFRIMIEPIATQLQIDPINNVIANQILFDSDLFYNGFDTNEYTSQDMGKPKAIQHILDTHPHYQTIVMIGDGMTDAQTKPPAAAFIGFGGVVVREKVQQQADWFIHDFQDLIYLLNTYGNITTKL